MRQAYTIKHSIKIRLYPNKTQQLWIDCNLQNATDFHNYLLSNIYYDDTIYNEETGEEQYKEDLINWDIINTKGALDSLRLRFYTATENIPSNKLRTDRNCRKINLLYRNQTITNIYDQVRDDVRRNFTTYYRDSRGKPKYKSNRGRVSFRIPQSNRDISLERRSTELNHNNEFDYKVTDIINEKYSSKLSHNLGWLHIPSCGSANQNADDFIKCFCPCNISKDKISSVTITREPTGKYYASIVLRYGKAYITHSESKDGFDCIKQIGLDMNVSPKTRVVTDTYGFNDTTYEFEYKDEIIKAPTPYKDYFVKLSKEQRALSKKVKFSKNWFKQKVKLAKIHAKIANIRLNFNRQTAAYLTKHYQSIAIEDLSISQMKRGQPRWFQKLYNDANLYQLRQAIRWSCLKTGRELNYVTPEHTSKTCHDCWYTYHDLKLGQSSWTCSNCGVMHHRDINAARNIYSLAWANEDIEGELSENYITYDPFKEREPILNELFITKLSKIYGEEVTTVSA